MAKISSKNGVIVIGGYLLSTFSSSFDTEMAVEAIEVTGFGDGCKNYIPGVKEGKITLNVLWDSAVGSVHTAIYDHGDKHVTLIPEGYSAGAASLSLDTTQVNYNPTGNPSSDIQAGSIEFVSTNDNPGLERGEALFHGVITNSTDGTAVDDRSGAAQSVDCSGTLHVWTGTGAGNDEYEVKIQHRDDPLDPWVDLVTFTLDGTVIGSERVVVPFVATDVERYRRVEATRTVGVAGDDFGFTVHFWRDVA